MKPKYNFDWFGMYFFQTMPQKGIKFDSTVLLIHSLMEISYLLSTLNWHAPNKIYSLQHLL